MREKDRDLVKRLVFGSAGMTRAELAGKAGLDVRTAALYAGELCQAGLARERTCPAVGKGRPSKVYSPSYQETLFVGLLLLVNEAQGVLCGFDGEVIRKDAFEINLERETKLAVIRKVLALVSSYVELAGDRKVAGVGIALSRWLRPPISTFDIFHDIAAIVGRHVDVPVLCEAPIDVRTYGVRQIQPAARDIIVVHPGMVLEFGLQVDGEISDDNRRLEYEFSHFPVKPDGERCYCGNHGCLENYVTRNAILETYRRRAGEAISEARFFALAASGDALAVEIAEDVVACLWKATTEYASRFNVQTVAACLDGCLAPLMARRHAAGDHPFAFLNLPGVDTTVLAAKMAADRTVRNFCP